MKTLSIKSMAQFLNKIIGFSIYGTVFLVPLAFAPFTVERFEFTKQYALFFFVLIGLVFWFAKMVLEDKEIVFKKSPLNIPILALAGVSVLSALFSKDHVASLLGSYGRFSDGLLGLLSFVGLYFLIVNTIDQKQIDTVLTVFFLSVSVIIIGSLVSLFVLPGRFGFFVGASADGASVFFAFAAVMLCAIPFKKSIASIWQSALLGGALVLLCAINFFGAWLVLLGGLFGLLLFLVFQRIKIGEQISIQKVWLPFLLLVAAVIFLFSSSTVLNKRFGPIGLHFFSVQHEMLANQSDSWNIGIKMAFGGVKNFLLGSGLGTFGIDSIRYGSSAAHLLRSNSFAELFATEGFLGFGATIIVALLFLAALAIRIAYAFTIRHAMFFAAMAALAVSKFVYYETTAFQLAFWLILALGAVALRGKEEEFRISLKKYFELAFVARITLLIIAVVTLASGVFLARFYAGDMAYAKSQTLNFTQKISKIANAIKLNPYRADYSLAASKIYFTNVLAELQKNKNKQDPQAISLNAQRAIQYGERAHALAKNRVEVVQAVAFEYSSLAFVAGAEDWAAKLYLEAEALEPSNAALYNELGKLYLLKSDLARAKEQFKKALSLNGAFKDTLVSEALLLEKEGDTASAIQQLEDVASKYPPDSNVLFQLGRMYFNSSKISIAIDELTKSIQLEPNFSNAHFALAAAYEKQGNAKKAVLEYKKVLQLNPDNKEMAVKLKSLQQITKNK